MRILFAACALLLAISCRAAQPAHAAPDGVVCPEGTALDEASDACAAFVCCVDGNGKRQGPAVERTEGTRAEGHYVDGLPHGTWRVVDDRTGRLLGTYEMNRGEGLERRWWPTGELLWEGRVHLGSPDGTWKYFARDGKITRTEEWKNDELVHEEGELLCRGDVPDVIDKCPDDPQPNDDGCPDAVDDAGPPLDAPDGG